jgi:hypothetical protein
MRKHKKTIVITIATVIVIAATLGIVAFAQADDQPAATGTATSNITSIWDRIASILDQNTGATVTGTDLQQASDQARQQVQDEALSNMLKKLVDSGKITQKQADDYMTWLGKKPAQALTDEYQQWLNSRPQDLPFRLPGNFGPMMGRGFNGMGKMFHGWAAPNPPPSTTP